MPKSAGRPIAIWSTASISLLALAGCKLGADVPVVTTVNTLCVETVRYHVTPAEKAVFAAGQITIVDRAGKTAALGSGESIFGGLVRWLVAFNKVRDGECLKPSGVQ